MIVDEDGTFNYIYLENYAQELEEDESYTFTILYSSETLQSNLQSEQNLQISWDLEFNNMDSSEMDSVKTQ